MFRRLESDKSASGAYLRPPHLGPNNGTLDPDLLINIAVYTLFRLTSVPLQCATPKQTASYSIPTS